MRLDMEAYEAIYEAAPHWLQIAMDLGLQTLQLREYLVLMRYTDIKEGRLYVEQRKTGKKIRIGIGPELKSVIDASRDHHTCPFIVHRQPTTSRPVPNRQHPMQVTPDQLTRAFRRASNKSGYYNNASALPNFHEIRRLGMERYRDLKWPEDRIRKLLGHSDLDLIPAAYYDSILRMSR